MARTLLTAQNCPSVANGNAAGILLTETAADTVNQNVVKTTGRQMVIAHNSGVTGRTVTITSAADVLGRVKPITAEAIAAGAIRIFGPFDTHGWQQTANELYFEASHAEVLFGILTLP